MVKRADPSFHSNIEKHIKRSYEGFKAPKSEYFCIPNQDTNLQKSLNPKRIGDSKKTEQAFKSLLYKSKLTEPVSFTVKAQKALA
jgi:hypothetical protein